MNKRILVSTIAIRRAKSNAKDKENYKLCIDQCICPVCACDLSIDAMNEVYTLPEPPAQEHYICSNSQCDFKHPK